MLVSLRRFHYGYSRLKVIASREKPLGDHVSNLNVRKTKILVIRRDNIGDLVCTTPFIHAVRQGLPDSRIDALVTSYNAAVVLGNPDLDNVYTYTKAKHRGESGQGIIDVHLQKLRLLFGLRREKYDYVILANVGFSPRPLRLASWIAPRHIVGFVEPRTRWSRILDLGVPPDNVPRHQVEGLFRLLAPLGITGTPGPARVFPDPARVQSVRQRLAVAAGNSRTLAVHLSSRLPRQRWPADRFAALIQKLYSEDHELRFALFWSPGSETNAMHPGDDEKALQVLTATQGLPVTAFPTGTLDELIAGLSICDAMICSDGGAMHIAAALGKPMVCFFGNSDSTHWHPWAVPYVLLQPTSRDVGDISVDEAHAAFGRLMRDCATAN
jgi:ADP-heptose:LPS heptosyltransferase